VIILTVAPRVEKTHERASVRIERTNVAPLPCIASKAGKGKVVDFRHPAMLAADDMVYLMREYASSS
jgi:hypothetical protein